MATRNYEEALRRCLAHEGGYTNDRADPGGPTNWGITIHDARKYWKPNATAADVRAMPLAIAKNIYRQRYWDIQKCDQLPSGVDYTIFDYGVNSGIGRSGKVLRRVLGMSDATHVVTPEVLAACAKRDPNQLVRAINGERINFLHRLRTWPVFGKGWGRRVAEVQAVSLAMIAKAGPIAVPQTEGARGKGEVPEPKGTKDAIKTTSGVGSAGWLAAARNWVYGHPVETALIVVAVIGFTWFVIYQINKHRARKQDAATPGTVIVPELAV